VARATPKVVRPLAILLVDLQRTKATSSRCNPSTPKTVLSYGHYGIALAAHNWHKTLNGCLSIVVPSCEQEINFGQCIKPRPQPKSGGSPVAFFDALAPGSTLAHCCEARSLALATCT
jgi:hypothetical protein